MFSIVIPAYNEQNSISDAIIRCQKLIMEIGDSDSEIIVVNDGSTDDTETIIQQFDISISKHPHNVGYGAAIKTGINKAKNDIIIITDADGTYPIESIQELILEYRKGFNMVVGARQGKNYHESIFKKIFRLVLKSLVQFTAGRRIPDINSGLRIFSKNDISSYLDTLCDSFSFTTSLTLGYMMTGKFVKYIPIRYNKRVGKTKVKILKDSIRTIQYVVEAILYYNPIKIFIVFSFFLIIVSLISLVIAFLVKILIAYIIGISIFLLAILMFGLGLLSIQLKQILYNIKNKDEK